MNEVVIAVLIIYMFGVISGILVSFVTYIYLKMTGRLTDEREDEILDI